MRDSSSLHGLFCPRTSVGFLALAISLSCAAAPPSEPLSAVGPAASSSDPAESTSAEPLAEPPATVNAAAPVASSASPGAEPAGPSPSGSGTPNMLAFIGIGRGERVAELGAGTRDSMDLMLEAVGPAGVLYMRHDPRTLTALPSAHERAKPNESLPANVVLMTAHDETALDAAAKDLNVVTMLFSYHDLVARGIDRRKLNLAVYRALVPSGSYVIADLAPPPGTSADAARTRNRVDEQLVRSEVEAAGFKMIDSAELVSNTARTDSDASQRGGQYILKFRKAR